MTTVLVLGDVHGNATALRAALERARSGPMDHLVFVGDLLTYGHDVDAVLDLVEEAQLREHATLLIGNHDQMYFDLAEGRDDHLERLPEWILDSVKRTLEHLDLSKFRTRFRWSEELELDGVLFAHANPFRFGDWTYLDNTDAIARAKNHLRARGCAVGVFGHTHRPRWANDQVTGGTYNSPRAVGPIVMNVGSVGQPRDGSGCGMIVRLVVDELSTSASFEQVVYDVDGHLASLRHLGFGDQTLGRLTAFFR